MNKKGFSLVELLAVIVVLAIVAAITMTVIVPMLNDKPAEASIINLKEINSSAEKACAAYYMGYAQYGVIDGFTNDCASDISCTLEPNDPVQFMSNLNVIGDSPDKVKMILKNCIVQESCVEYSKGQFRGLTIKLENGTLQAKKTTNEWKCQ